MFCIQIDDYKKKYKWWRKENNKCLIMLSDMKCDFKHQYV